MVSKETYDYGFKGKSDLVLKQTYYYNYVLKRVYNYVLKGTYDYGEPMTLVLKGTYDSGFTGSL